MYPNIVDLAGFDSPPRIEGKSLVPLMVDPRAWDNQDTVAFSQFHRSGNRGYSVRTQNFRYTEWRSANTGTIVAQELYDHRSDPQENLNVANSPEREEQLRYAQSRLHQQWPLE